MRPAAYGRKTARHTPICGGYARAHNCVCAQTFSRRIVRADICGAAPHRKQFLCEFCATCTQKTHIARPAALFTNALQRGLPYPAPRRKCNQRRRAKARHPIFSKKRRTPVFENSAAPPINGSRQTSAARFIPAKKRRARRKCGGRGKVSSGGQNRCPTSSFSVFPRSV